MPASAGRWPDPRPADRRCLRRGQSVARHLLAVRASGDLLRPCGCEASSGYNATRRAHRRAVVAAWHACPRHRLHRHRERHCISYRCAPSRPVRGVSDSDGSAHGCVGQGPALAAGRGRSEDDLRGGLCRDVRVDGRVDRAFDLRSGHPSGIARAVAACRWICSGDPGLAWTLSAFAIFGVDRKAERRWIRIGGSCILAGAVLQALVMRDAGLALVLPAVAVMDIGFGVSSSLMNRRVLGDLLAGQGDRQFRPDRVPPGRRRRRSGDRGRGDEPLGVQ